MTKSKYNNVLNNILNIIRFTNQIHSNLPIPARIDILIYQVIYVPVDRTITNLRLSVPMKNRLYSSVSLIQEIYDQI